MFIKDMPEFRDKKEVLTFEETVKISEAVDAMAAKNYGAAIVTSKGKPSGIFTERDLLRRVAASRIDIEKTKLKDVMTKKIHTAKTDDDVSDSLRRMSQGRFRHMPIINEKGDLEGMLSQGDFVAFTMSDIIHRASESAKAQIEAGRGTPFTMLSAIFVYTIGIILAISIIEHFFG